MARDSPLKTPASEKNSGNDNKYATADAVYTLLTQRNEKVIQKYRSSSNRDSERDDDQSPKSITLFHPTAKRTLRPTFLTPKRVRKELNPAQQFSVSTLGINTNSNIKTIDEKEKLRDTTELNPIRRVGPSPDERIMRTYTSNSPLKRRIDCCSS